MIASKINRWVFQHFLFPSRVFGWTMIAYGERHLLKNQVVNISSKQYDYNRTAFGDPHSMESLRSMGLWQWKDFIAICERGRYNFTTTCKINANIWCQLLWGGLVPPPFLLNLIRVLLLRGSSNLLQCYGSFIILFGNVNWFSTVTFSVYWLIFKN